jgi:DNA mismatch endonuclease (patch repair protein)
VSPATDGTKAGRPASARRKAREITDASSWASSVAVRGRMQRQPTRDTAPELAVRRALHAAGLRYRVDTAPLRSLRRRADIVFGPAQVAVFIDGCFWHGCPEHGSRVTHANPDYWSAKVERNRARDRDTDERLRDAGWLVIRAWEHEDPADVVSRVVAAVAGRRRVRIQRASAPDVEHIRQRHA